jgi:hypothetical protein
VSSTCESCICLKRAARKAASPQSMCLAVGNWRWNGDAIFRSIHSLLKTAHINKALHLCTSYHALHSTLQHYATGLFNVPQKWNQQWVHVPNKMRSLPSRRKCKMFVHKSKQ